MNFAKVIERVRRGRKIAKISGTIAELKQARKAISSIDDRIVIT
jgi:hypothetical protein